MLLAHTRIPFSPRLFVGGKRKVLFTTYFFIGGFMPTASDFHVVVLEVETTWAVPGIFVRHGGQASFCAMGTCGLVRTWVGGFWWGPEALWCWAFT